MVIKELIDGKEYYSVNVFAEIIQRTAHAVYELVRKGNAYRKLKSLKIEERVYIPASELAEFPFITGGRGGWLRPYHYDEEGKIRSFTADEVRALVAEASREEVQPSTEGKEKKPRTTKKSPPNRRQTASAGGVN